MASFTEKRKILEQVEHEAAKKTKVLVEDDHEAAKEAKPTERVVLSPADCYQNTSKNGDTKDSSKSRGAEDQRLNHRIDDPTTEHKRQGCTSEG